MNVYLMVKNLCSENRVTMAEVEKACNLGHRSIYNWQTSAPSADKLSAVADFFGVSVDYLLGRETSVADDLEDLKFNPELRTLLSASAKLTKEDIAFVTELVRKMHRGY